MGTFALDVRAFVEKTKKNNETVMRQVSLKLFSAIIKASPVDTGRFRMNWQAASGAAPAVGVKNAVDRSGAKAISQMASVVTRDPNWYEFTLTNNLPYAPLIEYGGYASGSHGPARPDASGLASFVGPHKLSKFVGPKRPNSYVSRTVNGYSKQAPQGVVRINVARFNALLEQEAAKVR